MAGVAGLKVILREELSPREAHPEESLMAADSDRVLFPWGGGRHAACCHSTACGARSPGIAASVPSYSLLADLALDTHGCFPSTAVGARRAAGLVSQVGGGGSTCGDLPITKVTL